MAYRCVWNTYPAINWADADFKDWLEQFPALYVKKDFNEHASIQDPIRYSIHYRGVAQIHRYHSTNQNPVKEAAEYKFKHILSSAGVQNCNGNDVLDTLWQKALFYREKNPGDGGYTIEGSTVVRW